MAEIIVKTKKDLAAVKDGDTIIFQLAGSEKALQSEDPFKFLKIADKEVDFLNLVNERLKKPSANLSEVRKLDGLSADEIRRKFTFKENKLFANDLKINWKGLSEKALSERIFKTYNQRAK